MRPGVAALVLLAVYVALSFLNDPGGSLGTDTGAKVATMRAASDGFPFGDTGYWAERWDPEGRLHPLYQTNHLGDRWVVVTTVPALLVGTPLYAIGGYRAALLVPMLGGVAAALAARALARRLGAAESTSMAAFWAVGLGSPVAVYALDFWEHALGVAALGWAAVFLVDAAGARRPLAPAGIAGALIGVAATMRTESLVYGAAAVGVLGLAGLVRARRDGSWLTAFAAPVPAAVAAGVVIVANSALERAVIGESIRSSRIASTASGAGEGVSTRVREAILTSVGFDASFTPESYLVGLAVVLVVVVPFVVAARTGPVDRRLVVVPAALAAALFLSKLADPGFVPGLLVASPLAAVGGAALAVGRVPAARAVGAAAVAALPAVWWFQYVGGAAPQWGGRYILPTGWALLVVGVVALAHHRAHLIAVGVVAAVAAAVGLAWLSVRSHGFAEAGEALAERREDVLVSREPFLLREWGSRFGVEGDKRWLTVSDSDDFVAAAEVATAAGATRVALVDVGPPGTDQPPPRAGFPGYRIAGHDRIRLLSGVDVRLLLYDRE